MINPARIRILAVGKVRKGWLQEGIALYRRRFPGLEVVELRDGGMAREAEAISAELRGGEQLVALCEEGQSYDSLAFAKALEGSGSERLAFVIGGADGLEPALKGRAPRAGAAAAAGADLPGKLDSAGRALSPRRRLTGVVLTPRDDHNQQPLRGSPALPLQPWPLGLCVRDRCPHRQPGQGGALLAHRSGGHCSEHLHPDDPGDRCRAPRLAAAGGQRSD